MSRDARAHSFDDSYLRISEMGAIRESPSNSMPATQESTSVSSSSLSPQHRYNGELNPAQTATPALYRTNFGKSMAYNPPANGVWGHQQHYNQYSPRSGQAVIGDDASSDVPFDQMEGPNRPLKSALKDPPPQTRIMRTSSERSRPFDERTCGEEPPGISPGGAGLSPRGSPRKSSLKKSSNSNKPFDEESAMLSIEPSSPGMKYQATHEEDPRYRIMPPRISDPITRPYMQPNRKFRGDGDGIVDTYADDSLNVRASTLARGDKDYGVGGRRAIGRSSRVSGRDQPEDDGEDSLFEFEEKERRRKAKKLKNYRRATQQFVEEDTDDTSLENHATLTERTHAAWKRKSARSSKSSSKAKESHGVSFGKDDEVHTFDPDPDETFDSCTLTGRSLNSEYTKSAESEVEDLIKDIFMIGSGAASNPGRRKVKYSPQVKEQLRRSGGAASSDRRREIAASDEEDDTLETETNEDNAGLDKSGAKNAKRRESKARESHADEKKEDDPFQSMWTMFEGGLQSISSALGLDDGSNSEATGDGQAGLKKSGRKVKGCDNLMNYVVGDKEAPEKAVPEAQDILETAPSLEDDIRLVNLALQAARSIHMLRGYEFDEEAELDILSDIKFAVVDLSLPLGLIFQENETGCWITKVLPDGSAARTGLVEVGDQLAAVDGTSAIRMKVDEIATIIKRKQSNIELTFLRYIGPLRPAAGTIAEEGYEVKHNSLVLTDDSPERRRCTLIGKRSSPLARAQAEAIASARTRTSIDAVRPETSPSTKPVRSTTITRTTTVRARPTGETKKSQEKGRFRWFGKRKQTTS